MNYHKINRLTVRALGAALLLAVPASVAADHSDIVVQPSPALQDWQQDTSKQLNRALDRGGSQYTPFRSANNSIVQIGFTLGEDGRPDDVQVYDGDGNWAAKRAARRAVKSLAGLDQVPVANPQNVQFLANIIFADNERIHDRLEKRLQQMEAARLASSGPERTYVALSN